MQTDNYHWLFNSIVDKVSFEKLSETDGVNTSFVYGRQGKNNNKQHNEVIFEGKITKKEIHGMLYRLNDEDCFIPGQVGLPNLQKQIVSEWDYDTDHYWHKPGMFSLTTKNPTENCLASDFAWIFMNTRWDENYLSKCASLNKKDNWISTACENQDVVMISLNEIYSHINDLQHRCQGEWEKLVWQDEWEKLRRYFWKPRADDVKFPLEIVQTSNDLSFAFSCILKLDERYKNAVELLICNLAEEKLGMFELFPPEDRRVKDYINIRRKHIFGEATDKDMEEAMIMVEGAIQYLKSPIPRSIALSAISAIPDLWLVPIKNHAKIFEDFCNLRGDYKKCLRNDDQAIPTWG